MQKPNIGNGFVKLSLVDYRDFLGYHYFMLKIRLQRVGRKHDPSFRIVLTDSRRGPKSGVCSELLGSYDARNGKPQLKSERIKHWLLKGAQVSDTVRNLLIDAKIIEGEK